MTAALGSAVIFAIIGVAIVVIAALAFRVHRKREQGRAALEATPAARVLPTIKIVYVGNAGAGKTMQLVAMHHAMTPGSDGIKLQPHASSSSKYLSMAASDVLGSPPALPDGSRPARNENYAYTLMVRDLASGKFVPLFIVEFIDYAGEHNSNPFEQRKGGGNADKDAAARELEERIEECQAVFCVLNGAKVLKAYQAHQSYREAERAYQASLSASKRKSTPWWRKKPEQPAITPPVLERQDIEQEVWQVLNRMAPSKARSVHLVLTKWDMLHEAGIGLDDAVGFLRNYPELREPADYSPRGTTRIIPSSASGIPPFFRISEDGAISWPGGSWEPLHPFLPVACAINDMFTDPDIIASITGPDQPDPHYNTNLKIYEAWELRELKLKGSVGTGGFNAGFEGTLARRGAHSRPRHERQAGSGESKAAIDAALSHLLGFCRRQVDMLDGAYPASRL